MKSLLFNATADQNSKSTCTNKTKNTGFRYWDNVYYCHVGKSRGIYQK